MVILFYTQSSKANSNKVVVLVKAQQEDLLISEQGVFSCDVMFHIGPQNVPNVYRNGASGVKSACSVFHLSARIRAAFRSRGFEFTPPRISSILKGARLFAGCLVDKALNCALIIT